MTRNTGSLCTRCGLPRIVSRTWEEKVETYASISIIINTETVCPDPKCQKIVEAALAAEKKKREEIQHNKEVALLARKAAVA